MAQMLRKQIYISKKQRALLKRLSQLRGLSESEIIRQAIEREATSGGETPVVGDTDALEEIIAFALSRRDLETAGEPYRWQREDAYDERLNSDESGSSPTH